MHTHTHTHRPQLTALTCLYEPALFRPLLPKKKVFPTDRLVMEEQGLVEPKVAAEARRAASTRVEVLFSLDQFVLVAAQIKGKKGGTQGVVLNEVS
jgi:hypothetical protein